MISATFLIMLVIAYLVGSLSGARITAKLLGTLDPTQYGSKNPGATNMYRVSGLKAAILTFTIDVFKGVLPLWGSYFLKIEPLLLGFIAIACCLGHIFPIYYQFKGGKAVATAFGAMLPIGLDLGLGLILTWVVSLKISRYSSVASICSVLSAPIMVYFLKPKYTLPVLMLSILIVARHIPNIRRILKGTEPQFNDKSQRETNSN